MTPKHEAKRWTLAIGLLVVGALILAGCGGSSGGSSAASTTTASDAGSTTGVAGPEGMEISDEAKACLKEKGVELPEIKGGQGGGPPMGEGGEPPEGFEPPQGGEKPEGPPPGGGEDMRKAFEECGVEMGEFKGGPGKGASDMNLGTFKKQIREYAACVRENGYELAEPNFSDEGPVFEKSESESAAFKKASAQCQDLVNGR